MRRSFVLALALMVHAPALAVPLTLTHQGRVLDATGVPLEGPVPITFQLFESETGGSAIWSEPHTPDFVGGYFSVTLGEDTFLQVEDFASPLYLGIVIAGTALPDRVPLSSVPYALRAASVDGGSVDAAEILVNGELVVDDQGNISWDNLIDVPGPLLADLACDRGDILEYGPTGWRCAQLSLSASDLVGGTVPISVLPVGTDAGDVAAGDHTHDTTDIVTGTLSVSRLPMGSDPGEVAPGDHRHDGAHVTSGTVPFARLPVGTGASQVAAGTHVHDGGAITTGTVSFDRLPVGTGATQVAAGAHAHDAAAITTGTVALGRLPVGTTTAHVASGSHTHTDADLSGPIDADTLGGRAAADFVSIEATYVRGAALGTGATFDGTAVVGDALVLTGSGYGDGRTDLVVTTANSPYVLRSGVHEFRNVTVQSGAVLTTDAWNGVEGGSLEILATGDVVIAGTIDLKGKGYRGGLSENLNTIEQWIALGQHGAPGESWKGYGFKMLDPVNPNGGGGGGGGNDSCSYGAGGGGGSYGSAGTGASNVGGGCVNGITAQNTSQPVYTDTSAKGGLAGQTYGDAAISRLWLGSGGGGSGSDSDCKGEHGGDGGNGGGALAIRARSIAVTGTIDVSGATGQSAWNDGGPCGSGGNNGGGGGGSGGSLKLVGKAVSVTGVLDARGGAGGTAVNSSTAGGVGGHGRIRAEGDAVTVSGTVHGPAASTAQISAGDKRYGTWLSPLISFQGPGRFYGVDLFADVDDGVTLRARLCASETAAGTTDLSTCVPIAPSGAVDAPDDATYGRVRLTIVDASEQRVFALKGMRATYGP